MSRPGLGAATAAIVLIVLAAPTFADYLLIPDSTAKTVGMYDPYDGTYLGNLIDGSSRFSLPINAVPGPDGNIYVSDQNMDAVFVFNPAGEYLSTYADANDGLNDIRGIAFQAGHLFVTSGDDYVAEFNGPHSRLPDFIADGSDPYDILFLADGGALVSDIQGTGDNIRLYDAAGNLTYELFKLPFPEQIQFDALRPGEYLSASFTGRVIYDFGIYGAIVQVTPLGDFGRGVFRLGNGNLLSADADGVWELEPGSGVVVEQEYAGSMHFIEYVPEPSPVVMLMLGTLLAKRRW
ncbi:MAG: hypothetical protein KKB50_06330 [Planctomycetes bacterium]|nr:hypothetical protein [Planctomycetota bacterium]